MNRIAFITLLAVPALTLIGCATPAAMRERGAQQEITSKKSAQMVAMCIVDRWENLGVFGGTVPVNMRPIQNGYSVSWRNPSTSHTGLMVDVTDQMHGSKTKYYKNVVIGEGAFDNAVVECQQ